MAPLRTAATALALVLAQPLGQGLAEAQGGGSVPNVTLDADNIFVRDNQNTVIAEGNVKVSYEGRVLTADRLEYYRDRDRVRAIGNVVITDPDGAQRFADEIETDSSLDDGFAIGFSARLPNGAVATANSAVREQGGVNALDKVVYTACELCDGDTTPTWALRADRAVLNENNDMISYRDAVLEIAGLPVIYLPYFAHPDPSSGRRSGLLIPSVGLSDKLGPYYQQPYYWVISPSSDLTISPKVMAKATPLMEMTYRKRFWSGEVSANMSFTKEQEFDSDGEKFGEDDWRGHIYAEGLFEMSDHWAWGFGLEKMYDELYTRRYDIEGENIRRGLYDGQPRRLLTQLYTVGQDTNWYADASILSFDDLRENNNDEGALPTATPHFFAEKLWDFDSYGQVALNTSGAFLTRENGLDSRRASLGADWASQYALPGGFLFEPFAEGRYDYYDLADTGTGTDNVTRAVGNVGARLSYPLYRPGEMVDILLEPTAMAAIGTSDSNDPDIPNEDALLFEFDEAKLFEPNGASGYDLYEGDAKASLGVVATGYWKNGWKTSATVGKRWRGTSDPAFNELSNLSGTRSDWLVAGDFDFGRTLGVSTRLRLDDEDLTVNRIDGRVRTQFWRFRGSARYYKLDADITPTPRADEGVDLSAQFQVTDRYSLNYARRRDLQDGRDLQHVIGVTYEDDCSIFQIAFIRSEAVDRELGPNDGIRFQFALKTIGQFGSNEFD